MTSTITIGVSLKLYLDVEATVSWAADVVALSRTHPAVLLGAAKLFLLPTLPALDRVARVIGDAPVQLGAQDLFWEDRGAYTGAVSGADLVALGCRYVEIGHAERREVFGEDESVTHRKFAAAIRNGLIPVLCVGERSEQLPEEAAAQCIRQIDVAMADAQLVPEMVVAYEPEWAIGRAEPAGTEYVRDVTGRIRAHLRQIERVGDFAVIYGGSAKPGLLSRLGTSVDGLFLGRFAHDPKAVAAILDEALAAMQEGSDTRPRHRDTAAFPQRVATD